MSVMAQGTVEGMALPADRTLVIYNGVEFRVGEPVSHAMKDLLPEGATLWDSDNNNRRDGRWFTKIGRLQWRRSDSDRVWGRLGDQNHFRSLPDMGPEPAPEEETAANYKRRFAQWITQRAALRSEAHAREAARGLTLLGLDTMVGLTVDATSSVCEGTLAAYQEPHDPGFTVFRSTGDGWVKATGRFESMADVGTAIIISSPHDDPFIEQAGDQAAMIAAFQQQVWDVGHGLSQENSWCSEYERILEEFGIFGENLMPMLDTFPTVTDVGYLLAGSIIARRSGDRWHLKVRNPAGAQWTWRIVARSSVLGSIGVDPHVVRTGTERCNIKPLMWHLPEGTQVAYPEREEVYTRNAEGLWECGGVLRTSSRFKADIQLVSLP